MSLRQKGPIATLPTLDLPQQNTVAAVAKWDGIVAATHWHLHHKGEIDGADFYLGNFELGHIHLDGWVHLATNRCLRDPLVEAGFAQSFSYSGYEHWVRFAIKTDLDAKHATWLFKLNYRRLRGEDESRLITEMAKALAT